MGLRGFGPWLRTHFPQAFRQVAHGHVDNAYDHVYIDVNTILYTNARTCRTGDQVLRSLGHTLYRLTALRCKPTSKLFLAVDGAASIPKIVEQRERRRVNGERAEREGGFDCRQFTPGCLFMLQITERLVSFARGIIENHVLDPSCEVVVDPGTRAGEGEFKILQDINRYDGKSCHRIAIISTDTDLALYPLLLGSDCHNHDTLDIDVHIPFLEHDSPFAILSMKKLKQSMSAKFGHLNFADLLLITLLSGNDYLPTVPGGFVRKMMDSYACYLKTGKYSPFYDAATKALSVDHFKQFIKFHIDTQSTVCKLPSSASDSARYFCVLYWMLQMIQSRPDHGNKLADLQQPASSVSFEGLLDASCDHLTNVALDGIDYIPGAIGLSLLSPEGSGRRYLPNTIRRLEEEKGNVDEWWNETDPKELLLYYNQQVDQILQSTTTSSIDKQAMSAGHQFVLKDGHLKVFNKHLESTWC